MAVSGNVFTMEDSNTETFTALCRQLAGLIRSASSDFEDIVASSLINPWAKYKPENIDKPLNITLADRIANGYGLAIDMEAGYDTTAELNIRKINSIDYIHAQHHNRMRDFDGYDHTTRSQLQLSQDEVIPSSVNNVVWVWSGPLPNGVPFDTSIERMWKNADAYSQLKLSDMIEFGWVAFTYSGFVRASGVLSTSFDGLRSILQSATPSVSYAPYNDFRLEPKGRIGKLIVYGRTSNNIYTQLISHCSIANTGSIHPVVINGWTPNLQIGTTTTGFAISVKDWKSGNHKGQYIMFGTDDDLYFDFEIENTNAIKTVSGGAFRLGMTIGNKTYYSLFSDDSSSALPGNFTIGPLGKYGPYSYSVGNVIYRRPRFFVQLSTLKSVFPEFFNKSKYDVTFSIWYSESNLGPLADKAGFEDGNLVSRFTLPMQCTGATTTNPIDPPSDIKPVPPSWDVEIIS